MRMIGKDGKDGGGVLLGYCGEWWGVGGGPRPMAARLPSPYPSPAERERGRLLLEGVGEWGGGVVGGVVAVNFGHPPARCARVPLRGAKGGISVLCFSLDSRVRGNDVGSIEPTGVSALLAAESGGCFFGVDDHADFVPCGLVLCECVGESIGFVGALHAV